MRSRIMPLVLFLVGLTLIPLGARWIADNRAQGAEQPVLFRPLTGTSLVLTETSTVCAVGACSGAFVGHVRVFATTNAFIDFASTNPFASNTTGFFLEGGEKETLKVGPGGFFAVRSSDITGAANRGYIYIEGLSQ